MVLDDHHLICVLIYMKNYKESKIYNIIKCGIRKISVWRIVKSSFLILYFQRGYLYFLVESKDSVSAPFPIVFDTVISFLKNLYSLFFSIYLGTYPETI